jgi:hypothetical protein
MTRYIVYFIYGKKDSCLFQKHHVSIVCFISLVGVRQELEEKQKPKHLNPPFANKSR